MLRVFTSNVDVGANNVADEVFKQLESELRTSVAIYGWRNVHG